MMYGLICLSILCVVPNTVYAIQNPNQNKNVISGICLFIYSIPAILICLTIGSALIKMNKDQENKYSLNKN